MKMRMSRWPALETLPKKANSLRAPFRSRPFASLGALCGVIALCLSFASPAKADADGEDFLAQTTQARQAYEAGRWDDARQRYAALAEKAPDDTEIRFRLGNVYARLGRLDEAVATYQELLSRQPAYPKGWHNLALVRLNQAMAALNEAQRQGSPEEVRPSRRLLDALDTALSGGKPQLPEAPVPGIAPPAPTVLAAYTAARVNLRSGCGAGYPKLATLAVDARSEVLDRQGACAQVKAPDGQIGWLPLSLLRLAPAADDRHEP
jgi:tetratricopeptide (TPR) repeat protein